MSDLLRIYTLDEARETILKRVPPDEFDIPWNVQEGITAIFGEPLTPEAAVRRIVHEVRIGGDAAIREWTALIDRVELSDIAVAPDDIDAAAARLAPHVLYALTLAAERIRRFYQQQPVTRWIDRVEGMLGQIVLPIDRAGVYVPGGTAPLPSSLLMTAIPAQVAGVREITVCTPPGRDGSIPDVILAAAKVAGVDRIFRIGGAQAIAAMAFGTESVPRVDKIVGPGNLFVMLAKRQVYGAVGIDGLFGPTETMILADEHANPDFIAADLLAQAEHDVLAQAILVTTSRSLAAAVAARVAARAENLTREAFFSQSLRQRGGAVIVPDVETMLQVANEYAAEHLQLCLDGAEQWIDRVRHAGAIFIGEHSFEVLGDYVAGPSHSLPTGGTARFASGINVLDFVKITSVIGLTAEAAARLAGPAATLAYAEELTAHAAAAEAREAAPARREEEDR